MRHNLAHRLSAGPLSNLPLRLKRHPLLSTPPRFSPNTSPQPPLTLPRIATIPPRLTQLPTPFPDRVATSREAPTDESEVPITTCLKLMTPSPDSSTPPIPTPFTSAQATTAPTNTVTTASPTTATVAPGTSPATPATTAIPTTPGSPSRGRKVLGRF